MAAIVGPEYMTGRPMLPTRILGKSEKKTITRVENILQLFT